MLNRTKVLLTILLGMSLFEISGVRIGREGQQNIYIANETQTDLTLEERVGSHSMSGSPLSATSYNSKVVKEGEQREFFINGKRLLVSYERVNNSKITWHLNGDFSGNFAFALPQARESIYLLSLTRADDSLVAKIAQVGQGALAQLRQENIPAIMRPRVS